MDDFQQKDIGQVQFLSRQEGRDPDLRGLHVVMEDLQNDLGALPVVRAILGDEKFDLFSWHETYDGTSALVNGVVKELLPTEVFKGVQNTLANHPAVKECDVIHPITSEGCQPDQKALKAETYDSSWYWPTSERFPKSDYNNPSPIRIAQADTGISLQQNVVGGFRPSESMDFFFPEHDRKGRGVICWGESHPLFITHGTSTGGMMIGEPAGDLPLHGMTLRSVVELVPCRVTDSVILAPGDVARLAQCIEWAVDQGIKVVNVSLGAIATPNDSALAPLTKAVERAYKNGIIVCCASGQITLGMIWPAVYSLKGWVICCGPSKQNGDVSHQSTWLTFQDGYVSIGAPGEDMPQAMWKNGVCSTNDAELGASEGSSYSAAFTSSVAALWWAMNYDTLSRMAPQDIVPAFRNTIQKTCTPWSQSYPKGKVGPGILNPNKAVKTVEPPGDYNLESSGFFHVERVPGGTYRNVTLHAHGSGSIHVREPVFVEGKLTLISESSATISMSGTIICRELEIRCKASALIEADDLEFYESCTVNVSAASTCRLYMAAEGRISGSVTGPHFFNGSTFRAWIYWRQGRRDVTIEKDDHSTVDIYDWGGRWA